MFQIPDEDVTEVSEVTEVTDPTDVSEASDLENKKKVRVLLDSSEHMCRAEAAERHACVSSSGCGDG